MCIQTWMVFMSNLIFFLLYSKRFWLCVCVFLIQYSSVVYVIIRHNTFVMVFHGRVCDLVDRASMWLRVLLVWEWQEITEQMIRVHFAMSVSIMSECVTCMACVAKLGGSNWIWWMMEKSKVILLFIWICCLVFLFYYFNFILYR